MPRLPSANDLGARPVPNGQKAIATYDVTATSEAAARLGQVMTKQGAEIEQQIDEQGVNEFRRKLNEWEVSAIYDPEKGAASKRGRDAFELPQTVPAELDKFAQQHMQSLGSARQKAAAQEMINSRKTQLGEWANRYAGQQRESFFEGQYQADVKSTIDRVALLAPDPAKAAAELKIGKDRVVSYLRGKGRSEEEINGELREFAGKAHVGALNAFLAADDIDGADRYMQTHGGEIDIQDSFRFSQVIKKQKDTRVAIEVAADAVEKSDVARPQTDLDRLTALIIMQESRGKHTDSSGKLTKSKAGALGITQVMPATGKDPGYGIKPLKDQSEAEYRRFGRDYITAMLKEFGNDTEKALAAYNAGPAAVHAAERKFNNAQKIKAVGGTPPVDGNSWLDFLSDETKNYVATIGKQYQSGLGKSQEPTLYDIQQSIRTRLGSGNPELLRLSLSHAEDQYNEIKMAKQDRDDSIIDQAYGLLQDNGGYYDRLPAQIRSQIPGDKVGTLLNFAKNLREGTPTNQVVWYDARKFLSSGKAMTSTEILALRPHLDPSDFQEIVKMNEDVQQNGAKSSTAIALNTSGEIFSNLFAQSVGATPDNWSKHSQEKTRIVATTREKLDRRIAEHEASTGRKATPDEIKQMAHKFFVDVRVPGIVYGENRKKAFQVQPSERESAVAASGIQDVPAVDVQKIRFAHIANGKPAPSDQQIVDLYNSKIRQVIQ